MNFEEAKTLLSKSIRSELRDHAFGDKEVYWETENGVDVASGYSGASGDSVDISYENDNSFFSDEQAIELMQLGRLSRTERNDSIGPDQYQEGVTMPGLTNQGVYKELINK